MAGLTAPRAGLSTVGAEPAYFYGLDVIRFVAAAMVALFHLSWRVPGMSGLMPVGWLGVQVFFVISGFIIVASAQGRSPADFVRSRFYRLYPTAWCSAAISVALLAVVPRETYWSLGILVLFDIGTVVNSLALIGHDFLASAYWTLPVELAFYLIVYVRIRTGRFENLRALAWLLVLWSFPLVVAAWLHGTGRAALPWTGIGYGPANMLLLRHGMYFGLGIFIWLAHAGRLRRVDALGIALALVLAMLEIHDRSGEIFAKLPRGSGLAAGALAAAAIAVFLILIAGIVAATVLWPAVLRRSRWRDAIRLLGLMTFPVYLLHEVVGGAATGAARWLGAGWAVSLVAALTATAGLGWLVVTQAEPWLRGWLRRRLEPARA